MSTSSTARIHTLFKSFRQKLRHVWEEYSFVLHYAPDLHESIKTGSLAPMEFSPFLNTPEEKIKTSKAKSVAVLGQVTRNSIKNRVLLESIGAFEDLIGKIAAVVYQDFPGKLVRTNEASDVENYKLAKVIISSKDKNEIIERMIEEKVRSIFYNNPVDVFKKDTAKLELDTIFRDSFNHLLAEYAEITARRNIIVHNSGRVDRKYLREVPTTPFKLGNKALISDDYLRKSLAVLEGIAVTTAETVVLKLYKGEVRGKLAESLKSFKLGVAHSV